MTLISNHQQCSLGTQRSLLFGRELVWWFSKYILFSHEEPLFMGNFRIFYLELKKKNSMRFNIKFNLGFNQMFHVDCRTLVSYCHMAPTNLQHVYLFFLFFFRDHKGWTCMWLNLNRARLCAAVCFFAGTNYYKDINTICMFGKN